MKIAFGHRDRLGSVKKQGQGAHFDAAIEALRDG
jgi:hypothetical protein